MGQLPADLRASCSAYAGTSATCSLTDGTVVLYQLFDTATEAHAGRRERERAGTDTPCPPSAAPAETPVVCSYEAGAETGVAAFSQTVHPPRTVYEVRWSPDAHPRLRGVMTTDNTTAQGWESLQSNWTRLAEMD